MRPRKDPITFDHTPFPPSGNLIYGGIPTSIGEIINIKYHLDLIKDKYQSIELSFHMELLKYGLYNHDNKVVQEWKIFLAQMGQLFFSSTPYILRETPMQYGGDFGVFLKRAKMQPQRTRLPHLLCKGKSLDIGKYIVLTTKARNIFKRSFLPKSHEFWKALRKLSQQYKIVILGEADVEMRVEYGDGEAVFSLYEQIITNLSTDCLVDLTVPALGEKVSSLAQIQQDCLIMKEAQFVIVLGVGGNFCLSTASADLTIGYREDNIAVANELFTQPCKEAIITKNWNQFIATLNSYT